VNLISSGMPLEEARLARLSKRLDHFQLSFQGAREDIAHEISGTKSHAQKLRVLDWLKKVRVRRHPKLRHPPAQYRSNRRNAPDRRILQCLARRIRQRAVYGWAFTNREHCSPAAPN